MTVANKIPSMKTFYLIKSFLPFVFLPIAPGVVQVELERHGFLTYGGNAFFPVLMQIAFTLGIIVWLTYRMNKKNEAKEFLKMSCVSKKVYHNGTWMTVEQYLAEYHNILVSHGMTPEESEAWVNESQQWLRKEKEQEQAGLPWIKSHQDESVALAK